MWLETTHLARQEESLAIVEEAWTLETDSLRIVIICHQQRKNTKEDFRPNWVMRCFGLVTINYHDLWTSDFEIAKTKAIQYLKQILKHIDLELEEYI